MTILPNPYPGARPLSEEHSDLLLGRRDLLREFAELLRDRAVIEVAGPSGVGKSSFISAGLCGRLDRQTSLVIRAFSSWSELPTAPGTVFYAEALRSALRSGTGPHQPRVDDFLDSCPIDPDEDPFAYVSAVNDALGNDLVVVFDQVEELLRDEPHIGRQLLANVRDVAEELPDGFTQVVSLREEYVSHLKVIEENLHPSLWRYKVIAELGAEVLPEMVTRPLKTTATADCPAVTADPDLAAAIERAWLGARGVAPSGAARTVVDESRPGLLHAQAFLYAAFSAVDPGPGEELTADGVAGALAMAWPAADADREVHTAFLAARLEQYVAIELRNRSEEFQARTARADAALIAAETTRVVAALPDHLSSAGYKLVRGTDGLAATVLTQLRELHRILDTKVRDEEDGRRVRGEPLRYPEGMADGRDAGQQVQPLAIELAHSCRRVQQAAGDVTAEAVAEDVVARFPGLRDWGDSEIAAGRMYRPAAEAGLGPSSALVTACELVLTYERALEWLERSAIVRMTQTRGGRRMVAIVHDGFGPALTAWAVRALDDPAVEAALPVAITGKQVFYRPDIGAEDQVLTADKLASTQGLGWIGCNVTASFRGITFKDCDLRSTLFRRCRFEDVVLEDCVTHGILFLECEFAGEFVVRTTTGSPLRPNAEVLKSITFGAGCRTVDDGVIRMEGARSGYGLFLDGFIGRWEVVDSDFSMLRVSGPKRKKEEKTVIEAQGQIEDLGSVIGAGPGRIVRSPAVTHVVLEDHPHPLWIEDADDAPAYIEAPKVDIRYGQADESS